MPQEGWMSTMREAVQHPHDDRQAHIKAILKLPGTEVVERIANTNRKSGGVGHDDRIFLTVMPISQDPCHTKSHFRLYREEARPSDCEAQ